MIESRQETQTSRAVRIRTAIELSDNTFLVDAALIGELPRISPTRVPALMHEGKVTSACERGMDEHEGEFRPTSFYRDRRA